MGKPYAGREPDARCCWPISTTQWAEKKAELVGGPAAAGGAALAVMLDTCTLAVFTKMNSSAGISQLLRPAAQSRTFGVE